MEYIIIRIEFLAEIYNIVDNLGIQVGSLHK